MVPTAELAGRFVDGSETVTAPIPPVAPVATSSASESVRGGFSLRFVLAYLVIYNLCFPVGSIPGTVWLGEQYQELVHVFVSWVARVVFGKVITVFPNGSGDTTYNYVEVFTFAIVAAAGAAAWTLARRGRPVSARAAALVRIYVRYALGATMLAYGWVKVMPLQFTSIGPDSMVMTYGDSSPMGLLWRFMGASAAYQMFAGFGEVLGGALLFWRRTTLLGALIAAGVLTNVAMLNFCFDVPVKLFSVHLLLMAAFLIAPDIMRLIGMIVLNIPVQPAVVRPLAIRRTWLRRAVAVGGVLLFAELAIHPAYDCYRSLRTEGLLAPRSPLHGVYQVESFTSDGVTGRDLPDDARWVRVGIHQEGIITFQRASGTGARYRFERDEAKGTLTLNRRDATAPVTLRFTSPEAGVVKIEGEFEGRAVSATLRKRPDDSILLSSRGFRWINEYPFNR